MNKKNPILKTKKAFLNGFLRTESLQNLLPLYIVAISKNDDIYDFLPTALILRTVESLQKLQDVLGPHQPSRKTDFSRTAILRNLRDLGGSEFLSEYISSIRSTVDPQASEVASAEYWLNEVRSCVTGTNGLFSNDFDCEKFIDGFIEYANGERVLKTKGSNDPRNADYLFPKDDVIIELKILQTDFVAAQKKKLDKARKEAITKIHITGSMILGTDKVYPKELYDAEFAVLRDALQRITKSANKQIKSSKITLNRVNAKGVVLFLTDGFYSVSPHMMIELLQEPLKRQYTAIDAIVVFSFRRKVTIILDGQPYDYFIFEPRYRSNDSIPFTTFIDRLGSQWFEYLERLSGKNFNRRTFSFDSLNLSWASWK